MYRLCKIKWNDLRINFFYLWRTFCPHLASFCVVSSFTMFRPNFTSGLLQVILPRPRIGMPGLVTVSPVITAFYSCCLSHHVFWPSKPLVGLGRIWNCYLLIMLILNRRDSTPLSAAPRAPKAVITGDTVTRLSIPIRGRCKSPEEGQRWNLAET